MILVFAEHQQGRLKKTAFEAVTFGARLAKDLNTSCVALVFGHPENPEDLGKYGASTVYHVNNPNLEALDSKVYTIAIANAFERFNPNVLVLSHTSTGKSLLGRLGVRLGTGTVPGIQELTGKPGSWMAKRSVYSGKAFAQYSIPSQTAVVSLMGNALKPEITGETCPVENLEMDLPESQIAVRAVNKVEGTIPLPEAELVVSAGRGMKGPENWTIVEELAQSLGASLACSRPVADADWRPHHEHVGQTGVAIRPNLYIAIGISGAIQHLAGVNNSKVIVVINKDQDAPFFKAADYGVCADLFEVVPNLTEAIKRFKAQHA